MSRIPSIERRSPRWNRRLTRKSVKTVLGRVPALRPRLPGTVPSIKQAACRNPVGEYFDAITGSPQESVGVFGATTFGRSVFEPKSKFVSAPVKIANGRPALASIIGARVQFLNRLPATPGPGMFPDW